MCLSVCLRVCVRICVRACVCECVWVPVLAWLFRTQKCLKTSALNLPTERDGVDPCNLAATRSVSQRRVHHIHTRTHMHTHTHEDSPAPTTTALPPLGRKEHKQIRLASAAVTVHTRGGVSAALREVSGAQTSLITGTERRPCSLHTEESMLIYARWRLTRGAANHEAGAHILIDT